MVRRDCAYHSRVSPVKRVYAAYVLIKSFSPIQSNYKVETSGIMQITCWREQGPLKRPRWTLFEAAKVA